MLIRYEKSCEKRYEKLLFNFASCLLDALNGIRNMVR